MNELRAIFIGGPADGKKTNIDARQHEIRIPTAPPELTYASAIEWTGWQGAPHAPQIEYTVYRVHILNLRGYGPLAICTTDFDLDHDGLLLALVAGYNPKKDDQL